MALRWYAVRTEPRAEYQAASQLTQDGFDIFFPRVQSPDPRVGHTDLPLFPGYLFLKCDPETEGWPSFRAGHRIANWVSFGGDIAWIPDDDVTKLMERVENINSHGGQWRRYSPGELVQVLSHGMEAVAEVVEEPKSPEGRVKVLLEFMGRVVSAQVAWRDLRPITDNLHRKPRRTRGKGRWIRGPGFSAGAPA